MINKKSEKSVLIPPHGGYRNLKSYQPAENAVFKTAAIGTSLPLSQPADQKNLIALI
jgi:hypothetical protein